MTTPPSKKLLFIQNPLGIVGAWVFTISFCAVLFAAMPELAFGAGEDASNVERGSPAQYIKVTGRGFAGEAQGSDLHVRIGEIRLESTGKLPAARYSALGIAVYRGGKILRAKWDYDVRGELTPSKPTATLTGQEFVMPGAGPQCLEGGCEVRLQLRVEIGPDAAQAHAEHTDFAALPVTVPKLIAKPPPPTVARPAPAQPMQVPRKPVDKEVGRALAAYSENRRGDADRFLGEALAIAFSGRKVGADHPLAALLLYQASDVYERQKMSKEQEQALRWSLAILEKHPDKEVQKAVGTIGGALDKEIVARRLGDFYWEQRRYDQAYVYYDRAYRYVPEVQMSDTERNRRLARNSAGRMAGACTQKNWEVADQAMKELKERIVKVDAETRKQLEYWVRTGEPRLAARKC